MDWLSQNWIWIVALVGGYYLMSRMGGCGMGHMHGHSHQTGGHDSRADGSSNDRGADTVKLFDPVSQHMLPAETGIASVHQGRIYYFEDRANREAFETEPEKYLGSSYAVGRPIDSPRDSNKHSHQGHGCC